MYWPLEDRTGSLTFFDLTPNSFLLDGVKKPMVLRFFSTRTTSTLTPSIACSAKRRGCLSAVCDIVRVQVIVTQAGSEDNKISTPICLNTSKNTCKNLWCFTTC